MKSIFNQAIWIGLGEGSHKTGMQSSAFRFRKEFNIKSVKQTHCYICGLGIFTLYINGEKVGDDVLSPAFTDYTKHALYVKYDVTDFLKIGKNIICVELGDGFYNQTTEDTWHFCHANWRNSQRLLLNLVANGKSIIVSDNSWKATDKSPTVHNAIRTGEYYDATKEDGWLNSNFDDSGWYTAQKVQKVVGKLCEQKMPPIRECAEIKAIKVWQGKNGKIYDFGVNIAGYIGFKAKGKSGETVNFRYAEKLDKNGVEIDQGNIDFYIKTDVFSQDRYTFKGVDIESWKPKYVYHGFRYVEISGEIESFDKESLTAYHVHTDLKQTGDFECSNNLLNWIHQAGIRSYLNNWHGFIQDCPHREKNGWTGDAAASAQYSVYYFDMKESYKKWLTDVIDTQRENGQLCSIAPTSGWGYNWGSGPAWDYALFNIPYEVYLQTGDTECIELVYPYAKKYLKYAEYYEQDGTVCFGLGDWRPPDKVKDLRVVSNRLSDTCYYYSMCKIMAQMAIIKNSKESKAFENKAQKIKDSIRKQFVSEDRVDNCGQGALAMVLDFGIVSGDQAQKIAKRLAETIVKDDYRVKVGLLGTKALFSALSKYGYTDLAYKVVTAKGYPSYSYWYEQGATTLWESWLGDVSLNHHMFGSVLGWIRQYIAGIVNKGVSYSACEIKPYFFSKECSCRCSTQTASGILSVEWKKTSDTFFAKLNIPDNCKCKLILPDKTIDNVLTGEIEIKL